MVLSDKERIEFHRWFNWTVQLAHLRSDETNYISGRAGASEDPNQLARTGNIRCTRDLATTVQHWGTGREASERASEQAEFERNTFHWAASLNNSHSRWLRFPRSVQFLFRPAAILPDFFHPLLFVHRLSIESACISLSLSLSFSLSCPRAKQPSSYERNLPSGGGGGRGRIFRSTRRRTIILRILPTVRVYIFVC